MKRIPFDGDYDKWCEIKTLFTTRTVLLCMCVRVCVFRLEVELQTKSNSGKNNSISDFQRELLFGEMNVCTQFHRKVLNWKSNLLINKHVLKSTFSSRSQYVFAFMRHTRTHRNQLTEQKTNTLFITCQWWIYLWQAAGSNNIATNHNNVRLFNDFFSRQAADWLLRAKFQLKRRVECESKRYKGIAMMMIMTEPFERKRNGTDFFVHRTLGTSPLFHLAFYRTDYEINNLIMFSFYFSDCTFLKAFQFLIRADRLITQERKTALFLRRSD